MRAVRSHGADELDRARDWGAPGTVARSLRTLGLIEGPEGLERLEEAVELANDTPYGLGSYVLTTDSDQALRVADRLEAGMVFVNQPTGSSPELPFGGVKHSGHGRELSAAGIREFCNLKTVWVGDGSAAGGGAARPTAPARSRWWSPTSPTRTTSS